MAVFAYLSYEYFKAKKDGLGFLFAALVVLFQPFFKIYLERVMTPERMHTAISIYEHLGYKRIKNYHPYEHMDDAVCYGKELYIGVGC